MPIYEYYCGDCHIKFDALRPMSQADDPIVCSRCQGTNTSRAISLFAAVSVSESGESRSIAGGSNCSTCAATTCASCVTR